MTLTEIKTAQKVEEVLSTEKEDVSQKETKEPEAIKEPEKEEITPEKLESQIQAEVDKRANTYREKREADTALIRSLNSQLKELKSEQGTTKLSKAMAAVLSGDEEEGLELDKIEARRKGFEEIKATIKDYNEKSAEVEEAAQFIDNMIKNLPAKVVKEFGLDDANPNVRAVNGVKLLDETAAVFLYNQDFLMVIENFLPKGDELRKQVEEIIEGLSEFKDEKSKKLYLKDKLQGVKVTPRKKPQTPSDALGGVELRGTAALAAGLKEEREKLKI